MSINSRRQCTKRVSKRKGREYVRKVSFSEAELFDFPFRSPRSNLVLSSWIIHILTTNLPCKKPRCISQAIAKNSFERCFQIIKKIYRTKWPILNILIIAIYNTLVLNQNHEAVFLESRFFFVIIIISIIYYSHWIFFCIIFRFSNILNVKVS